MLARNFDSRLTRLKKDGVKSPCTQENNYQLTYRYGAPLRPAIVGCRDPDTVGLIPDEWDATLRRSGYQSISKGRDDHCHHSLFPPGMQAFAKCDDESYSKFDFTNDKNTNVYLLNRRVCSN